jgi:hypothetical protein
MQLFGDLDILSSVRVSLVNWVGHVDRMDSKITVSQVFNNNPQGNRLRRRPTNGWWNCVQADINRCRIKNWKERPKNRTDCEKSVKDAKVRIGLQCHLRRSDNKKCQEGTTRRVTGTQEAPVLMRVLFCNIHVCLWCNSPTGAQAASLLRFLDLKQLDTHSGRTPLDEGLAHHRDLYLTTHNIHMIHTSMPPAGFEPAIPASEGPQSHALHYSVILQNESQD